MANEELIDIIRRGTTPWNAWRREQRAKYSEAWELYWDEHSDVVAESDGPYYYPEEPAPAEIDLTNARLEGIELEKADFGGVNLTGAVFVGAKLMGAEFLGAQLDFVNFSGANLSYADFSGAKLNEAVFESAILIGAKFDRSALEYVNGFSTITEDHVDYSKISDKYVEPILRTTRRLKVFLCHSTADKELVRALYRKLSSIGVDPWIDEEKILPGQDWGMEIVKAVQSSDVVIVCLSRNSINKKGYVQKEMKLALDVADEHPGGSIFIVPLKIEECAVPDRLRRFQWVSISDINYFEKLRNSLRARASELRLRF